MKGWIYSLIALTAASASIVCALMVVLLPESQTAGLLTLKARIVGHRKADACDANV